MPSIAGIDLSDGIRILTGRGGVDISYSRAAMVADAGNKNITQVEDVFNNYLSNKWPYDQIRVHIYSLSPLSYTIIVANQFNFDGTPYVISANWWELP